MADDAVVTLVDGKKTVRLTNLDSTGVILSGSFTNNGDPYVSGSSATYETVAHIIWAGSDTLGTPTTLFLALSTKTTKTANFRIYDLTNAQTIVEKLAYTNTTVTIEDMGTITNVTTDKADWVVQIQRNETGAEGRVAAILGLSNG